MGEEQLNGYQLSRIWFDWCFENPEKINPNHSALYFFCIEHCNRLGWKDKFGLPTTMAKEAIGIKSYNTYIKTLTDLVEFGFIKMIEKSKNQYSANIVALSKNNKALTKALDKALIKHGTKQRESIDSVDKPIKQLTNNNEQLEGVKPLPKTLEERKKEFGLSLEPYLEKYGRTMLTAFFKHWSEHNEGGKKMLFEMKKTFSLSGRLSTWKANETKFDVKPKFNTPQTPTIKTHEFNEQ